MPGRNIISEFVQYYYMLPKDIADQYYQGDRYFTVKSPIPAYNTWMPPFPARQIAEYSEKIWRVTNVDTVLYYAKTASLEIDEAEFMLVKLAAVELKY